MFGFRGRERGETVDLGGSGRGAGIGGRGFLWFTHSECVGGGGGSPPSSSSGRGGGDLYCHMSLSAAGDKGCIGGDLYLGPVGKSGRVCERHSKSGCGDGVYLSKLCVLSEETRGGTLPLGFGGSTGGEIFGLSRLSLKLPDCFWLMDVLGGIGGYGAVSVGIRIGEGDDGSLPMLLELG